MKTVIGFLRSLMLLGLSLPAFAQSVTNESGLSDCMALSVKAALDLHAEEYSIAKFPSVQIVENKNGKSNGIDFIVLVDEYEYAVIATPITDASHQRVLGCTSASAYR